MVADIVRIDRRHCMTIIPERLKIREVCENMVPKNLTREEKDAQKHICTDFMKRLAVFLTGILLTGSDSIFPILFAVVLLLCLVFCSPCYSATDATGIRNK